MRVHLHTAHTHSYSLFLLEGINLSYKRYHFCDFITPETYSLPTEFNLHLLLFYTLFLLSFGVAAMESYPVLYISFLAPSRVIASSTAALQLYYYSSMVLSIQHTLQSRTLMRLSPYYRHHIVSLTKGLRWATQRPLTKGLHSFAYLMSPHSKPHFFYFFTIDKRYIGHFMAR